MSLNIKWLRAHLKPMLVHGLILSGFLLFCILFSDSVFGRFEAVDGESSLQSMSLPTGSQGMRYDVYSMRVGTDIATVYGWAFIDGQGSGNNQTCVVLKSDRRCYVFDTMIQLSPNVASAYGDSGADLEMAGFACHIPLREIRNGEYVLGIYVKSGDAEAVQYMPERVLVKS